MGSLAGKDTIDTEVACEGGDGNVVDLLLNCTTRRDANGAIIGVLAVGQDITLRKKAGNVLAPDIIRALRC